MATDLSEPEGRLAWWAIALQAYNFGIIHRPGLSHQNANNQLYKQFYGIKLPFVQPLLRTIIILITHRLLGPGGPNKIIN